MHLYLLRHAEAEAPVSGDRARRLTAKGREQAAKVGKFCARHGIGPSVILSSPVVRARQTADLVAASLPGAELIEVPWAACGMDPGRAMDELEACAKFPAVPDLGVLAAAWLGMARAESLHVRKALLLGLEIPPGGAAGAAVLQFFLPVKLM
jgi:phosphohistidine phosphatase